MDFLISLIIVFPIIVFVGLIYQAWSKFYHQNKMPEGWRESETQREAREAWEKEQWDKQQARKAKEESNVETHSVKLKYSKTDTFTPHC